MKNSKAREVQFGGSHYKDLAIEPWDASAAWLPLEQQIGGFRQSVIKRMARMGSKGNALVDVKKAHHELGRLIEIMEESGQYEEAKPTTRKKAPVRRRPAAKKVAKKKVVKKAPVRKATARKASPRKSNLPKADAFVKASK